MRSSVYTPTHDFYNLNGTVDRGQTPRGSVPNNPGTFSRVYIGRVE
jgi:hypothetical protein